MLERRKSSNKQNFKMQEATTNQKQKQPKNNLKINLNLHTWIIYILRKRQNKWLKTEWTHTRYLLNEQAVGIRFKLANRSHSSWTGAGRFLLFFVVVFCFCFAYFYQEHRNELRSLQGRVKTDHVTLWNFLNVLCCPNKISIVFNHSCVYINVASFRINDTWALLHPMY